MDVFGKISKRCGIRTNKINNGIFPPRHKRINDQLLKGIFALGMQFYQQRHYHLASKTFRYLCIHDHLEPQYMAALGASEYQREEYVSAECVLKCTIAMDGTLIPSYFNLAKTLIAQQKIQSALEILNQALRSNAHGYDQEIKQVRLLMVTIKNAQS